MRTPIQILLRTLGIALMGAGAGALCGVVLLAADFRAAPGNLTREAMPYVVIVASFGAAIGALAAPALHWSILRHVPLGRALTWTTVGALAGGTIGVALAHDVSGVDNIELESVALTAIAGAIGAAGVLRSRSARGRKTP